MQLIRGIDGVKIAVYDPNPCGKREVLMVHGWPLSAKMYEYQERLLLEHGFRVVTMDLPGFGRSDAPAGGYSYDCLSDAVYAVVKSLGLCRFVLVGFSMGGAIVLRYMRRHRGYGVRKLALLAAAAPRFTCSPDFPLGMEPSQVDQLIEEEEKQTYTFQQEMIRQGYSCRPLTLDEIHILLSAQYYAVFEIVRHKLEKDEALDRIHLIADFFGSAWKLYFV